MEPRPLADSESIDFPTDDLSFFKYRRALLAGVSNDSEDHGRSVFVRLYLLHRELSELCFYHVFPNTIREPKKQINSRRLDEQGTNLTSVLREMQRNKIETGDFGDLRRSLTHVVPGITDVRTEAVGGYLVLKFKHSNIVDGKGVWLDASQESDGTLRMLALLTAVYQRRRPPLLGIEEPESAVHPGVLAVLAEIFEEASLRTQVVITTHSPDLIDRLPIACIRAVEFVDGETKVGKISETQAQAVKQGLFTAGELHSMEGLQLTKVQS
ncbi:MAG: AAA family ATPase [Dehalococcoidia bacterium]|nr:AAA family ATPase [Dehalococcoidia bacterium]